MNSKSRHWCPTSFPCTFLTARNEVNLVLFWVQNLSPAGKDRWITIQLLFQFKMTPLHLAAEKGNLQAVKKLVENASCPAVLETRNQVTFCLFTKSNNGNRVIDLFSLFVCFFSQNRLRDIFKGIFLLSSRNLCVHKAREEREISWWMFSRESSRDLLWENKMRKLKRSITFDSHLKTALYYTPWRIFLFSLFTSYAKSGETARDIAQRKEHWDVVTYLLEKLTGKISLKGDSEVNVSGQG